MDQLSPPPGGDQDRGGEILALFWTMEVVILIIMALRLWSRYKLRNTGMDDYVMIFTAVLVTSACIAITASVFHGQGRHMYYLSPKERAYNLKVGQYIAQPFAIVAIATGKISVGFLFLRIFGSSTFYRRWTIYICTTLTMLVNSLAAILLFSQCNPPRVLWEGREAVPHAKCWKPVTLSKWNVFVGSWDAFVDVALAILPLTFVWGLKLPIRRKVGLSVLLGSGILAGVCAAVKTSYLFQLNERSDLLWETFELSAWTGAENFVIIICGSIPTLKPVYDSIRTTLNRISKGRLGGIPSASRLSYQRYEKQNNHKLQTPWLQPGSKDGYSGSTVVSSQTRAAVSHDQVAVYDGISVEREVHVTSNASKVSKSEPYGSTKPYLQAFDEIINDVGSQRRRDRWPG